MQDKIVIKGARENNLKNINLEIPKNKLIVMTGVSGSGKSSLAFNTIYAEGRRRYVESLSSYARQFLGGSDKPDVDSIEGLSPSISIDQKTTSKNPRSTVGTVTEIYDFLRLLYARIGVPHCPIHKEPITKQTIDEIVDKVLEYEEGTKIQILSPIVRDRKGEHTELLNNLKKEGYSRLLIDDIVYDLDEEVNIDKNKKHNISVVIDRLIIKDGIRGRLSGSIETALELADGRCIIDFDGTQKMFSEDYACPYCDFSLPKLEPRMFSFNAPFGACDACHGLGIKMEISEDLIIPDKHLSINEGAIKSLNYEDKENIAYNLLYQVCSHYNINMNSPIEELSREQLDIILYGSKEVLPFNVETKGGNIIKRNEPYEGIITNLKRRYHETTSEYIREWIEGYMVENDCEVCHGSRLKESILSVLVGGKNIYEVTTLSINNLIKFFDSLKLSNQEQEIAKMVLSEIKDRLNFLNNVGLSYLNLARRAGTLSGGEAQRIRLATQIGSRLTGVLYVLDEPSIGLHQKDNKKLIDALLQMRDLGNTLIVVEHDEETMTYADRIVDIGPGAGRYGGKVVFNGTYQEILNREDSITGLYLSGKKKIPLPDKIREGNGKKIKIIGATNNNLKNIDVEFPLGKFIAVTGVSGSGKSSLVNDVLLMSAKNYLYKRNEPVGAHKRVTGLENIDKVVDISQSPIGRTPRSNPATYVGVFDDIRDVFAMTKEAKIKGYKKGRFSFNVKGGRCEACNGDGIKRISMHFLPDVYVPCEVCHGTRYSSEVLEINFKGKNIAEVLDMTVDDALDFFTNLPKIKHKLEMMKQVGLGYIKLGQPSPTLSGGEAQRVKLAKELQKKPTGKSLFILDEPTTGLHTDDVKNLIEVLNKIVDGGDTVVVIEHNLDVIKVADYIIDLGPEGGEFGGEVIVTGTPYQVMNEPKSYTGEYLKKVYKSNK
jgi:excinuclease ABC subunit A